MEPILQKVWSFVFLGWTLWLAFTWFTTRWYIRQPK
jgi:hypothetical protein